MNDTVLLITGTVVFGLMLIGVVMTILEFSQTNANGPRDEREKPISPLANKHSENAENG